MSESFDLASEGARHWKKFCRRLAIWPFPTAEWPAQGPCANPLWDSTALRAVLQFCISQQPALHSTNKALVTMEDFEDSLLALLCKSLLPTSHDLVEGKQCNHSSEFIVEGGRQSFWMQKLGFWSIDTCCCLCCEESQRTTPVASAPPGTLLLKTPCCGQNSRGARTKKPNSGAKSPSHQIGTILCCSLGGG